MTAHSLYVADELYRREQAIRRSMGFDNRSLVRWRIAYYCDACPMFALRPYAIY